MKTGNKQKKLVKDLDYLPEENEEIRANSPAKKHKLKEKLKHCQKEKEEYLAQAQRARADLINYRRRQEQLMTALEIRAKAGLIGELLPVLDALAKGAEKDRAIKGLEEQTAGILKKAGLAEIDSVGAKFNPQFHEAVEMVKSDKEPWTIVEEVQKGYVMGELVLRPSKVKVAK